MRDGIPAEFIWFRRRGAIQMAVRTITKRKKLGLPDTVRASNVMLPFITADKWIQPIYKCKTEVQETKEGWVTGPIFAVLAGEDKKGFQGSRINFRDIMHTARSDGKLIYVLPVQQVCEKEWWNGYIRLGYQKWMKLPFPRPLAVYNRIPTRLAERQPNAIRAFTRFAKLHIPVFNPSYFSKATIYTILKKEGMEKYLPESEAVLTMVKFRRMLSHHEALYLKPSGGSIGHGMIRVEHAGAGYTVSVLKNSSCETLYVVNEDSLWKTIQSLRLPGHYVIQEAIDLIEWKGRPCDFRVLLQKSKGQWQVVGQGVRVSGPNTITTHVPNGGYIANANEVLQDVFSKEAHRIHRSIESLTIRCAKVIDAFYHSQLGEMSMDIGVDKQGKAWFFEANAKPMKFDEPDIRARSLQGVVNYLEEISLQSP